MSPHDVRVSRSRLEGDLPYSLPERRRLTRRRSRTDTASHCSSWLPRLPAAVPTPGSNLDSTPEKLDGTESHEFEQDDLDAAAEASDAVKEYCAGAVSEAQRLGCESHVTDEDLP